MPQAPLTIGPTIRPGMVQPPAIGMPFMGATTNQKTSVRGTAPKTSAEIQCVAPRPNHGLDQNEDDAPHAAPECGGDHRRHAQWWDRRHRPGCRRDHPQGVQQAQRQLMEDEDGEKAGGETGGEAGEGHGRSYLRGEGFGSRIAVPDGA